jgi:hypothetical protein
MENDFKVVALIYSGKADPKWQLTKTQADHFLDLFDKAASSEKEAVVPSILGYKGIRLASAQRQFLLYDGLITCYEQGSRFSKKDEKKTIEKYLLNTAPEQILRILAQLNIGT